MSCCLTAQRACTGECPAHRRRYNENLSEVYYIKLHASMSMNCQHVYKQTLNDKILYQ